MNKKILLTLFFILMIIGLSNAYALNPDYLGHRIVSTGNTIDGKTLTGVSDSDINNNGDVVFRGTFSGGSGIFTPTNLLAATGDTIDGKTLTSVSIGSSPPVINDNGDVVFRGTFSGGSGIFTPTNLLAATGDTIDGKTLTEVSDPDINNNGDVVFRGTFSGGSGIFTPTNLLAATGDTIDGKTLTGVFQPDINNNGNLVFIGSFSGGGGIFTPTSLLAATGDIIDGKTLTGFDTPVINDSGDIVFIGSFSGSNGIFTPTTLLVSFPFDTIFDPLDINDNGDIAYRRSLTLGGGGIFIRTSSNLLLAATDETIDGFTWTGLGTPNINNNGEVVFHVGNLQVNAIILAFKPETGSTLSCGPNTFESGGQCLPISSLAFCGEGTVQVGNECFPIDDSGFTCGPKTISINDECVPDLTQICGDGTFIQNMMCFATSTGQVVGGYLIDIDNASLFVAAIGVNPVITGLVGITIAGVSGQVVWFVYRRKKSEEKSHF